MSEFAPVLESGSAPISPSELLRALLLERLNPEIIPGGISIGPVFREQIQQGVISLMDAGMPVQELYLPIVRVRAQIRCLASTLEQIDRMARSVWAVIDQTNRTVVEQVSSGHHYLIHLISVSAGPSFHRDSDENFEALMFVELMIGLEPVS